MSRPKRIIDAHQHVFWHGRDDTSLVADLDANGIEKALLLTWYIHPTEGHAGYEGVLNPVHTDWTGLNHPGLPLEDIVQANRHYPDRFILGYAPHPLEPDAGSRLEAAIKMYDIRAMGELKYLLSLYNEKRMKKGTPPGVRRFLYFDRAFHGRTVFALNITQLEHDPIVTKNFKGIIPGNIQVPFPSIDTSQPPSRNDKRTEQSLMIIEDCLKRYHEEIVAVVVEPIQGAGGQRVAKPEFFQRLSELTHKYDVFLAFDEVQTAGGQTGSMFAIDQFDLPHPPQAVAVAKKFANGVVYMLYPMKDRGVLDSTWGGNLADMVRWVQEIKIVKQEKLIEQVPEKAKVMIDGLNDLAKRYHNLIFNVRGMGLYQGFSLRRPADKSKLIQIALEDEQMLLLGAGVQTIRFRPVLDVTIDDIKLMLEKLDRCLAKLQAA